MVIETQRLILREMTENDFDALYRVLADSDIMQHYPYTFDEARVKNWIVRNIERYRIFGFGLWAVCLKESGEMIGDCGLTMQTINGQIKPEIGYHIRADKQRNGFAKEAAIAVRDWTFRNTPFNIVYSYMLHTNELSCKTAIAYGCRQVDEFNDSMNGLTKVFAITREEWANRQLPVCQPTHTTTATRFFSGGFLFFKPPHNQGITLPNLWSMGGFTMNPQCEYNKRIYLYSRKRNSKPEQKRLQKRKIFFMTVYFFYEDVRCQVRGQKPLRCRQPYEKYF